MSAIPPHDPLPATLAGVDDFAQGFLHYGTRITGVLAAADADPTHVRVNVYAGYLWMLSESPAGPADAAHYLMRVRVALSVGTSAADQRMLALLSAWIEDDIPAALNAAEWLLQHDPQDLVTLKLHQYLNFNRGRPGEMLRIALSVESRHRDDPVFLGMLAFAYEQCHLLAEAQDTARRALALDAADPWAQHALAHVLLTQGRIDEGAAFLEGCKQGWQPLSSFMRTHLWWHLCLFLLSQGRESRVLELYDTEVWAVDKMYSQDQIGAVSLLARLELAGVNVDPRWAELGAHLAARLEDTTQPFLSLQYLYGLARAGRGGEAQILLQAIRRRGKRPGMWQEITVPAAEGILAHALQGDPQITLARLGPVLPDLIAIGGSHAQRDLFEQIWLDALRRAGHWTVLQNRLEQRRVTDPDNVPLNRVLAQVYTQLGLPLQAAQAQQRADARARTAAGRP